MRPTKEQQAAIDVFGARDSMLIEAGAGTGKTATLVMLGQAANLDAEWRHGQYIAFNRAIVEEAKLKMPANVQARTAHSHAYAALLARLNGRAFVSRLGGGRVRGTQIARRMGIDPFVIQYGTQTKVLQPGFLASLAQRSLSIFCNTADRIPSSIHVPYTDGIDLPDLEAGRRTYENNDAVADIVGGYLGAMWDDITDPNGMLPFKHDYYLKMWELDDPFIDADFILFDEAQDASPVMVSIVEQQAKHAQLVFVGDSQQAIYEWRGAINALESAPGRDNVTFLTQSFRFGPAIADVANVILKRLDADMRLVGTEEIPSYLDVLTTPDALLTRTNAVSMRCVLEAQAQGRKPLLLGGGTELLAFARGVNELREKGATSYPDLACFDSWDQVVEYTVNDPQGDELALNVKLVEEYGVDSIIGALGRMPKGEDEADVVVSTAHKAKGREWDTVKLAKDFSRTTDFGEPEPMSKPEWRLLYVACTRAKRVLDVSQCAPVMSLLGAERPKAEREARGKPPEPIPGYGRDLILPPKGES